MIKLEWFLWNYDEENTSALTEFPCTTTKKLSMQNAHFHEEISRNALACSFLFILEISARSTGMKI